MPEDGSKLRDVSVLADEGTELSFEIPLARMVRLVRELSAATGVARGTVHFGRDRGYEYADVQVAADVPLVCQRCMGPLTTMVESRSRVFLPHSEAAADGVPADVELMIVPEGRLRISELVEEDLVLALPLAPLHADDEYCAMRAQEPGPDEAHGEVQRPFAVLGDLMGRATRDEPKRQDKGRGRGD